VNPEQLVVVALRLLTDLNNGRTPEPADVQLLMEAFPTVWHLPLDDLCRRVIHALSGKVVQDESPLNVSNLISELHSELEQIDRQIASLEQSSTAAKTARPRWVTDDPGTAS
jgi:hypothetical protein